MPSIFEALKNYLPDRSVLDTRPPFDDDLSQPLFHKGNAVGCITLHGIGGTPANIRVVADALIEKGYTVISPMIPGHGETVRAQNASTGAQWLEGVRAAYRRLKDEGCEQVYALGLSLGGVLCGLLAEEEHLNGLALICTPIKMKRYLRIARTLSPIIPVVGYPESREGKPAWGDNLYAQMYGGFSTKKLVDLSRLARRLKRNLDKIDCPTLIVSAAQDDKVDPKSVELFCKGAVNAPSVEYAMFEHSPHGCTYGPERDQVAARCAAFVSSLVDNPPAASV
ncbi:MAG: alpha/beta fold hydrolase [Clostridiales bacterium]|nr:alpha/beta fold hydrolase [Clostridiales bacterium]